MLRNINSLTFYPVNNIVAGFVTANPHGRAPSLSVLYVGSRKKEILRSV